MTEHRVNLPSGRIVLVEDGETISQAARKAGMSVSLSKGKLSKAMLEILNVLLQDTVYIERVKRHYAMFRQEVDNKAMRVVRGEKRRKRKRKKRKA